jgi:HSP20 family protein
MVLARLSPFTLPGLVAGWDSFPTPTARFPLDVQRTEGGYRLQAALPGFKPEDVEVTLANGTLTISAKRSEDRRTEQGRYLRREVYSGSFQRRLSVPAEVTAEDVQATLENGVLTVDVRHAPETRSVRIPVGAAALPEASETSETAETGQPAG